MLEQMTKIWPAKPLRAVPMAIRIMLSGSMLLGPMRIVERMHPVTLK